MQQSINAIHRREYQGSYYKNFHVVFFSKLTTLDNSPLQNGLYLWYCNMNHLDFQIECSLILVRFGLLLSSSSCICIFFPCCRKQAHEQKESILYSAEKCIKYVNLKKAELLKLSLLHKNSKKIIINFYISLRCTVAMARHCL